MLVIGGKTVAVPGLVSVDFTEDARYKLAGDDYRLRRTGWVRSICIHTRMGIWPQSIAEQPKGYGWDEVVARRWGQDGRKAGAHIAVDGDGSYACMADVRLHAAYHVGQVNDYCAGIEMYQRADGTVHRATLEATVAICDVLTRELGIQRQCHAGRVISPRFARPTKGATKGQRLAYLPGGRSGRDWVGLFGHRNATRNRGQGDPGDAIWSAFAAAGYEQWDGDADEDLDAWAERQAELGFREDDIDGIAGQHTTEALVRAGKPWGLWVTRPGDVLRVDGPSD